MENNYENQRSIGLKVIGLSALLLGVLILPKFDSTNNINQKQIKSISIDQIANRDNYHAGAGIYRNCLGYEFFNLTNQN